MSWLWQPLEAAANTPDAPPDPVPAEQQGGSRIPRRAPAVTPNDDDEVVLLLAALLEVAS